MAAGVKIYNDSGTVQIDETYFNLVLIDKQTITISTPTTTEYDYSVAGDVVAVAVSVNPETFITKSSTVSGGIWTYRFVFFNGVGSTGTCTFTVYAFGKAPAATETVGLKVLDGSSNLIFHSQFKPLRILAINSNASGYTGPSGRNLAVMFVNISMYTVVVFPSTAWESDTLSVSGNVISSSRLLVGSPATGTVQTGTYAAIDVTHY